MLPVTETTALLSSHSQDGRGAASVITIAPLEEDGTLDHRHHDSSISIHASCWYSYLEVLDAHPIVVKSLTAFFILATADALGQLIEIFMGMRNHLDDDDDDGIDTSQAAHYYISLLRMIRFGLLGLCGTPFVHYYYLVLDHVLPPTPDPWTKTTFLKLFIDQGIQAPCVTLFIFIFVGLLEGKTVVELKWQLQHDYLSTMIANWKLFIPAQLINMAFCPPPLRVLFINVVFFFWSIILSVILHRQQ